MIRTTVIPESDKVLLSIPEAYIGKELSIIAFTRNEGFASAENLPKKVSFDALKIDTRNFKFNLDELSDSIFPT